MKKNIIAILGLLTGIGIGVSVNHYLNINNLNKNKEKLEKFRNYYDLLNQWLVLKHKGISLVDYFQKNNYLRIAIYGMGELGNRIYDELENTNISIEYAIDKNPGYTYSELEVRSMEDELSDVDVIIVTAVFAYDIIKSDLEKRFSCPIISLADVIIQSQEM